MNLPQPFLDRIQRQLGGQTEQLLEALVQSSSTSLRVHSEKFDQFLQLPSVPWAKLGVTLPVRPNFTLDPLFHAGCYYVQEASSMLLEQAMAVVAEQLAGPLRVLDLCAAPGGKSTHLLSLLSAESVLVANEVIRSRVRILEENIAKWGQQNCLVTNSDPAQFGALREVFDVIVVDAPCSGEGLFRKDPESVNQWSPENLSLNEKRQRRILRDVLPALRTGGFLIYSTCTYNPEENEQAVQFLIDELQCESVLIPVSPDWGFEPLRYGLQAWPHRVQGEGFFLSLVQKTAHKEPEGDDSRNPKREEKQKRSPKRNKSCSSCDDDSSSRPVNQFEPASRKFKASIADWISDHGDSLSVATRGKELHLLTKPTRDLLIQIQSSLNVTMAGNFVATKIREELIPEHGLALSTALNSEVFFIEELDWHQAIRYLRREPVETSLPEGFGLVTYQNHPLGWVKQVGHRSNNRYPQPWRIRMHPPEYQSWTLLDDVSCKPNGNDSM